jgi:hypothetical protein
VKKIPTVFRRDPEDMKRVLPEVSPGCEWVLDGEGVATRKYDGTCVRLDEDGKWLARREVRPGKRTPLDFLPVEHDEYTGKTVGWEPVEASGFAKWHAQALASNGHLYVYTPGTYELVGPKVQGNPEGFATHALLKHEEAEVFAGAPRDFDGLREWLLARPLYEGIVWHHGDGRMAKLKGRDFPVRV